MIPLHRAEDMYLISNQNLFSQLYSELVIELRANNQKLCDQSENQSNLRKDELSQKEQAQGQGLYDYIGRQKKDLLDEEDLAKQNERQELQVKICQYFVSKAQQKDQTKTKHKINDVHEEMFDAAKLEENYFKRNQSNLQNATDNDDDEDNIVMEFDHGPQEGKQQSETVQGQEEDQQVSQVLSQQPIAKKGTDKKRRRKPLKDAIMSPDEEDQKGSNILESKVELRSPESQKPNEDDSDISVGTEQKPSKPHLEETQNQEQTTQKTQSEFDNMLKQKQKEQSESEDEEEVIHLHIELGKRSKQERKDFYYAPLEEGQVSYCYFKRISSGLSDTFQLVGEDQRPILFCENQRGCIGCNYYMSMTKEMDKASPAYLGKLRGNATGSTYNLYDAGEQPNKGSGMDRSDWRVSLACIEYENNFMGFNGPRKLKVVVPKVSSVEDYDMFKLSEEESLSTFKPPIIRQFRNKTPKWNAKLKSYALNFGGRVKLASIKNFILIDNEFPEDDEDEADNALIFGKVDESTFSIEYRHPLSMLQAFGIVMSEFDFKINCE